MNTNEALNKIKAFKENESKMREHKRLEDAERIAKKREKCLGWLDEIREMEKIVNALADAGIDNRKFLTEGIKHRLGFCADRSVYWNKWARSSGYFGIEGGGACGGNTYIDIHKGIIVIENESAYHHEGKLDTFIKKYEEYKKTLYDFVEKL